MPVTATENRGPGRPPKPPEERLISNGIHMHPSSKNDLVEIVAFFGTSQREEVEAMIASRKEEMGRKHTYREWVAAGRPIPFDAWREAGKPKRWDGKHLEIKSPGA